MDKCFACDRPLKSDADRHHADTRDGQIVFIGSECLKKIRAAEDDGYQPPKGGPRLWLTEHANYLHRANTDSQ